MSISRQWELQQAIHAQLTAELAGEGPGATDVDVFDHVPREPDRLHVRIDGFGASRRLIKGDKTLHEFLVHVFDKPTTEASSGRGQKTVRQLQAVIVAALDDWVPAVTGATAIRHLGSDAVPDQDGLTAHAVSRFQIYMSE